VFIVQECLQPAKISAMLKEGGLGLQCPAVIAFQDQRAESEDYYHRGDGRNGG
jgi:hypothetical protein